MESIVSLVSITLQACSLVAIALQACSFGVVKYFVALCPYLSLTGEAAVLPSCYIPHSNKLSFAVIEAVFACASSPRFVASFCVVTLILLTFMKLTINTLVSTNRRSPRLGLTKNPLRECHGFVSPCGQTLQGWEGAGTGFNFISPGHPAPVARAWWVYTTPISMY
jgi:hypothetical protein